jgi:hypothetical protein
MRYQDRSRVVPLNRLRAEQECAGGGRQGRWHSRVNFGRRRSWTVTITDGDWLT